MPNASDFIGAVYDELAKLLNITDANPSIVMQLAWPGFSLSDQDFKPASNPTGPLDPQTAKETFSHLANMAPSLSKPFFQNSGMEIDDLYEILVTGAIPAGSTADSVGSNPIYKLFGDAQYEFLQARTGSVNDPNAFYYPCLATPNNWYDDSAALLWPTLNMQSVDIKAAGTSSQFVKAGGAALLNKGLWKLRPVNASKATTIKFNAQQVVINRQQRLTASVGSTVFRVSKPLSTPLATSIGLGSVVTPATAVARSGTTFTHPQAVSATVAVTSASTIKAHDLFTQKMVPQSSYARLKLGAQLQGLNLTQKSWSLEHVTVDNRYQLLNLINQQLPTKPAGNSDGFSISFRYCRVNIERSWLKLALIKMKGWYMFSTLAGEYSNGSGTSNPGMFPLLPTSFIAIRDLKITANWSPEDRQNIAQATALGFFDIRDATLNANTLEVKGLQILGWISAVTPQLPPLPSP